MECHSHVVVVGASLAAVYFGNYCVPVGGVRALPSVFNCVPILGFTCVGEAFALATHILRSKLAEALPASFP